MVLVEHEVSVTPPLSKPSKQRSDANRSEFKSMNTHYMIPAADWVCFPGW
jgi:hypothetical protein